MMEFHISRAVRQRYQFEDSLFSYNGNVVFADLGACRAFAHRMNQVRESSKYPDRAVHAGQLFAMGLIDEVSHLVIAQYRKKFDPDVMNAALDWFGSQFGRQEVEKLLLTFVEHFPGQSIVRGLETPQQWLAGSTEGMSHRAVALEELLLLWTANRNEAFKPFEELFEEKPLAERTVYRRVTQDLPKYFATRPLVPLGGAGQVNLIDLLRAPATGAPRSLSEQLSLIRRLWRPLLGDSVDRVLMIAGEILHEEELAVWMQFNPDAGRARTAAEEAARLRRERGEQQWPSIVSKSEVPIFGDPHYEYEKFSADTAWMPGTVLIAKSTYVWLAQLSKQYNRSIRRLDEIPDEELETLANRGLNSLWLIGVWERSRASKAIKLLCGNSDAVASAYSLYDYRIAADIGGEPAYINLRDRAFHKGIRLASDMVPNHMGIDSPWVVEHPEWFIARPHTPYPAYSFEGPDLSSDDRVEIKIEDHYFTQSDAAVVFRRRDKATGETRYIYHGNDGTSFPWNDTAQLDYLNAAVREQVIQTILHVARLFPVIRFDAAMTLAKRHFHRLWFPGPGSSGAIPSRAEYSMDDAQFNQAMPHEFWREVVDRVAVEVPGTLLLAEAFWLMEGYFVRTLGMHRVYNSAFMNMMRDEDNAKYRSVIKNTLEFDPDIMKRYVNFMSNPDERTAIDQFGTGDKCFGVAVVMSTLPGLPMFGHGQIEGFTEKYGMEYQRPRYDETPNRWLVERHEREIAPLLKKRWLFAESSNFLLYDFFEGSGAVNEDVFAYSNRNGNECALVVYNNRFATAHGTIDNSAAYADKGAGQLRQRRLREGLGITDDHNVILAWRDSLTGLEYLRRANVLAERGLTLELHAYQSHVFLNWRELRASAEYPWDKLCDHLNGRGVANLEDALILLELEPVHAAIRSLLDPELVRQIAQFAEQPPLTIPAERKSSRERKEFIEAIWTRFDLFYQAAQQAPQSLIGELKIDWPPAETLAGGFRDCVRHAIQIPTLETLFPQPWPVAARRVLPSQSPRDRAITLWGPVFAWCVIDCVASSIHPDDPNGVGLELFDRLRLREPLAHAFSALGAEGEASWRDAARLRVLLRSRAAQDQSTAGLAGLAQPATSERQPTRSEKNIPFPTALWSDPEVRWLMGVHEAEGRNYLVKEPFEELLWWFQLPELLKLAAMASPDRAIADRIVKTVEDAIAVVEASGYQPDKMLAFDRRGRKNGTTTQVKTAAETAAGKDREKPRAEQPTPPLEPASSKKE